MLYLNREGAINIGLVFNIDASLMNSNTCTYTGLWNIGFESNPCLSSFVP